MVNVLVHHAEIGLKKGNFSFFEKHLVRNIKKICRANGLELKSTERKDKKIFCKFDCDDSKKNKERIRESLKFVFGIKYFAFVTESIKDLESIKKSARDILESLVRESKGKSESRFEIAFKTKRSDKNFSPNSLEINKELGGIATEIGIKVNYKSESVLFTEIGSKVFMYTEKFDGFGGLPVGTAGRVLVLLSGGIDSPVAAWLAMRRGCKADFLHFHTHRNSEEVIKTKMGKLLETINKYQTKSKAYFVPSSIYEVACQGKFLRGYDLIMFKHYMLRVADKIALEKKYDAIVTGDNLSQVASQTIENLNVTSKRMNILSIRPLIAYDKQEIIDLAKKIGTYSVSIENYKDCCSVLSKNPSTKTKIDRFDKEVKKIDLDLIIKKSIEESEIISSR